MRTTLPVGNVEPVPAQAATREAGLRRARRVMLVVLPLVAVVALVAAASAVSAAPQNYTATSKQNLLTGVAGQLESVSVTKGNGGGTDAVLFINISADPNAYTFANPPTGAVMPSGWTATVIPSYTKAAADDTCPGTLTTCTIISFKNGTNGASIPSTGFTFKVPLDVAKNTGSPDGTDTWRVVANLPTPPNVAGTTDFPNDFSVTRQAIGVKAVKIEGPGDLGAQTALPISATAGQEVNVTITVSNALRSAQNVYFSFSSDDSKTETKGSSGNRNNFVVDAGASDGTPKDTVFYWTGPSGWSAPKHGDGTAGCATSGCGFSYNFSDATTTAGSPRVVTFKLVDDTNGGETDGGLNVSFNVGAPPSVLAGSTFTFFNQCGDSTPAPTSVVLSSSGQNGVLNQICLVSQLTNSGDSKLVNGVLRVNIFKNDTSNNDVTGLFGDGTSTWNQQTGIEILAGATKPVNIIIPVISTSGSQTPEGDYRYVLTFTFNDVHTVTTDASNNKVPVTVETAKGTGFITVDKNVPDVQTDPNLAASSPINYDTKGGSVLTIKPTVQDTRLDPGNVNLTLSWTENGVAKTKRVQMTRVGTGACASTPCTFQAQVDFASLGFPPAFAMPTTVNLAVEAHDLANNVATKNIGKMVVSDLKPPVIISGPTVLTGGQVNIGDSVEVDARVTDNYAVGLVELEILHTEGGTDVQKPSLPMTSDGSSDGYTVNFLPTNSGGSGTYKLRIHARDTNGTSDISKNHAYSPYVTINVQSSVGMAVQGATTSHGMNLTAAWQSSQVSPARFGTLNATGTDFNAQTGGDPQLQLVNFANAGDTFLFTCSVLPDTTIPKLSASSCVVNDQLDANGQPSPLSAPGLITATVWPITPGAGGAAGTLGTVVNATNGALFPGQGDPSKGVTNLRVLLTVPPSARPGDIARVQFNVVSRFVPSATANVVLGYEVAAARGAEAFFAWNSTATHLNDLTSDTGLLNHANNTKPGRTEVLGVWVNNAGNIGTNFTVKFNASASDLKGEAWTVDFTDSDPNFNPTTGTIQLPPTGSASFTNRTLLAMNVHVPSNAAASASAVNPRTIVVDVIDDAPTPSPHVASQVKVKFYVYPTTVQVDTTKTAGLKSSVEGSVLSNGTYLKSDGTFSTDGAACASVAVCTYVLPDATKGTTYLAKFTFEVTASSTSDFGSLTPTLVLQRPDGTYDNRTLSVLSGNSKSGTFSTQVLIGDLLGKYAYRLDVRDSPAAGGDVFSTPDASFLIQEPGLPPGGTPPTVSQVQVYENGATLIRASDGAYRANYGSAIKVSLRLTDNLQLGRAKLQVFQKVNGVNRPATPFEVPFVLNSTTAAPTTAGNRTTSAMFDATFVPGLPAKDGIGSYIFALDARDSQLDPAAAGTSDIPFLIDLKDLVGPTFDAAQLSAGGAAQDNLDAEKGVNVTFTARVHDNGDLTPGSNVDPASVKVSVRLNGAEVAGSPFLMQPVPGSSTDYNLTLNGTVIGQTGAYALTFTAADLAGNVNSVTRTLNVLVNLPPVVVVTSPAAVPRVNATDVYPIGGTVPIVFTITDTNVNETSGVLVEVASGNGTFTPFPGAVVTRTGATTITVAVSLAQEGAARVRVTATDTLGASNSTTADVLVDATPPTGASIAVDALDVGAGRIVQAGTSYVLSPLGKLQVTGSDPSGIGTVTVTVRPAAGGTARNLTLRGLDQHFTLPDVLGAGARDGAYVVGGTVRDAVGNAAPAQELSVVLDGTPPSIEALVASNPVSARVSDVGAGVKSVTALWGTSPGSLTQSLPLSRGADAWTGSFPAGTSGTVYYRIHAVDNVGNAQDAQCGSAPCSVVLTGQAQPPTVELRVTLGGAPVAAGGTVRGEVSIAWTALNAGGQAVPVTLRATDASGAGITLATDDASGSATWDTTTAKDGTWTLTATASDGALQGTASVQVVVRNLRVASAQPIPADVPASGAVLLSFEVSHPTRKVTGVVAVLKVQGAQGQQENVTLFDDGTHGDKAAKDGAWSALYTPRLKGQYSVDLQVTYDDGSQGTVSQVATFRAEGSLVPLNPSALVPVAVLAVLVVAMGAFGMRRWK